MTDEEELAALNGEILEGTGASPRTPEEGDDAELAALNAGLSSNSDDAELAELNAQVGEGLRGAEPANQDDRELAELNARLGDDAELAALNGEIGTDGGSGAPEPRPEEGSTGKGAPEPRPEEGSTGKGAPEPRPEEGSTGKSLGIFGTLGAQTDAKAGRETGTIEAIAENTPVVGQVMDAEYNRQWNNLRRLYEGDFKDSVEATRLAQGLGFSEEDIRRINEEAGYGGKNLFGNYVNFDMEVAKELYRELVAPEFAKRLAARQAAEQKLANNDLNWVQKGVVGGVGATKMIGSMANGPVAAATLGVDAMNRAAEMAEGRYTLDENGDPTKIWWKMDENGNPVRDEAGNLVPREEVSQDMAMLKGFAGAGTERFIWMGLGKVAKQVGGALVGAAEKTAVGAKVSEALAKAAGGSMKAAQEATEWLGKTSVGRGILKVGKALGWLNEKGKFGSIPDMMVKSRIQEFADEVVGLSVADPDEREEFTKWLGKFVSVKENAELFTEMLAMHLAMKAGGKTLKFAGRGLEKIGLKEASEFDRKSAIGRRVEEAVAELVGEERAAKLGDKDLVNLYQLVTSKGFTAERAEQFAEKIAGDVDAAQKLIDEGASLSSLAEGLKMRRQYSDEFVAGAKAAAAELRDRVTLDDAQSGKINNAALNAAEGNVEIAAKVAALAKARLTNKHTQVDDAEGLETLVAEAMRPFAPEARAVKIHDMKGNRNVGEQLTALEELGISSVEEAELNGVVRRDENGRLTGGARQAVNIAAHGTDALKTSVKDGTIDAATAEALITTAHTELGTEAPEARTAFIDGILERAKGDAALARRMAELAGEGDGFTQRRGEAEGAEFLDAIAERAKASLELEEPHQARLDEITGCKLTSIEGGVLGCSRFRSMTAQFEDRPSPEATDGESGKALVVKGLGEGQLAKPGNWADGAVLVAELQRVAEKNGAMLDFGSVEANTEAAGLLNKVQTEGLEKAKARLETRAKLVDVLSRSALDTGVTWDEASFRKALAETSNGRKFRDNHDNIYGFASPDGTLHFNPTQLDYNIPIHEYGHLALEAMKGANRKLWERGMELVRESDYYRSIKEQSETEGHEYSYLKGNDAWICDEALAHLIGDKGEKLVEAQGVGAELKAWLKDFWKAFKGAFGLADMTDAQIEKLTLGEFVDAVNAELLRGKEFGTRKAAPLKEKSIRRYYEAEGSGSNGMLRWKNDRGRLFYIPVDMERTRPGGKVVLSRDDASVTDWIQQRLNGVELRMSKNGKIYVQGRDGLEGELAEIFGRYPKIGMNDGIFESIATDLQNESLREMTPDQLVEALRKDRANYDEWVKATRDGKRSLEDAKLEEHYAEEAEREEQEARQRWESSGMDLPEYILSRIEEGEPGFDLDWEAMREIARDAEEGKFAIGGKGAAKELGIGGLTEAEAMEKSGVDRKDIWRKTGWWRGKDGKWRVELPDVQRKEFEVDPETRHFRGGGNDFYRFKLAELVEDGDFMKAYPQARKIKVEFHKKMPENVAGNFNEATLTIKLPQKMLLLTDWGAESRKYGQDFGKAKTAQLNERGRQSIVHELQHAIQLFENFAKGGSPTEPVRHYALDGNTGHALSVFSESIGMDPTNRKHLAIIANWAQKITSDYTKGDVPKRLVESFESAAKEAGKTPQEFRDEIERLYDSHTETPVGQYYKLAGEVEARNVQARLGMTAEERAATPPWETEDMPENRQIARFAVAVEALTAGKKNGRLSDVDQKRLTAVIRGLGTGELKHPRFTKEEAAASKGVEHEQLWNYILSLESPEVDGGGAKALARGKGGKDSQGGGRLGRLGRVATRYGSDPKEIAARDHKYLDRGAESRVYDTGDNTVLKVRRLDAYDMDGVKHALAKIVYHNYLFPRDAYQLHEIVVWKNERGFDEYYMILEQPLVTPKRDADGNIIAPSRGHIIQALKKTGQKFNITGGYYDNGDTSSGSSSGDVVESAKMVAASGDYAVYDFKPGRNTFLDAETGEVRFIDPRVDINDPTDNFAFSKFGKRRRTDAGFDADRQIGNLSAAKKDAGESPWTAEDETRYREQEEANAILDDADFNGQPSRKGEGAQKDSQQFKRWFGDSKVVDENGEPLVVYRGAEFDPLAQEAGKGVIKPEAYFTADPNYAKRYTGAGGKVRAYYLNIRKPFDIRDPECLNDLKKIYPDHEFARGTSGALDWAEASIIDGEFLKENFGNKYDGIIFDEGGDPTENGPAHRGVSYVPLDGGAQVKSATDNIGTFDPGNPDVRFAAGGQVVGDWIIGPNGIARRGTPQAATLLRQGYGGQVIGGARVADDAGMGERTPGSIAASRELSEQPRSRIEEIGRVRVTSFPISEMFRMLKEMTDNPMPVHVSKRVRGGKVSASSKDGQIYISSDVLGLVDRTDLAPLKDRLRQRGFFRNEDAAWAENHSPGEVRQERERSESQLGDEIRKLADRRASGKEPGGQSAERIVLMHEFAKYVMNMPRKSGSLIGDVQTVGDAVRGALNVHLAADGDKRAVREKKMRDEAKKLLAWSGWRVEDATEADMKDLTDTMFGAWLVIPNEMERVAPTWYDAILETITTTPRAAKAYRAAADRVYNSPQAYKYVLAEIQRSQSAAVKAMRDKLDAEAEAKITARSPLRRFAEGLVLGYHDRMGLTWMRINEETKLKLRARKAALAELKRKGATKAELKAAAEEIDLFTGRIHQQKQKLELSRTAVERGIQNESIRYVLQRRLLEQKATEKWGLSGADKSLYLDQLWVVDSQGRSGIRGESAQQARLILGDMARRLGPEKWARLEQYGREWFAIREHELLNDPRLERLVGKDVVAYWRGNAHYVTTKRVQSEAEMEAIERTREKMRKAGVNGGDDVCGEMYTYIGPRGGSEALGEKLWKGRLGGSFADKAEVRQATTEKDMKIQQAARVNQYVIDLRDALLMAEVPGVRDMPYGKADVKQGSRYGFINYFDYGEKRTLIVPRQIADGFKHDPDTFQWTAQMHRVARAMMIDYNIGYLPVNQMRNAGSMEKNVPGMYESWVKTLTRFTGIPGAAPLVDLFLEHAARKSARADRILDKVFFGITRFGHINPAERAAKFIFDPEGWQKKFWDAEARGDEDAMRGLLEDKDFAMSALRANMFTTLGSAYGDAVRDEGLLKVGKKIGEAIDRTPVARQVKKAADWLPRQNEFEDVFSKLVAFHHDRATWGKAHNRSVEESGLMVKQNVSIAEGERKGRNTRAIQTFFGQFFNMREKGVVRNIKAHFDRTKEMLVKDGMVWSGRCVGTMFATGAIAAFIRWLYGDDDKKAEESPLGGTYRFAKFMRDASQNINDYARKQHQLVPVWLSPDGFTTITLGARLNDEDSLIAPSADFVARAISARMGLNPPPELGQTVLDTVWRGIAPDLDPSTPVVKTLRDTLYALADNPIDDFTGKPVYDPNLYAVRNESWATRVDFATEMAKRVWDDWGMSAIWKFDRYGKESGDYGSASKWLGLVLNDIPMISSASRRFVKIHVREPGGGSGVEAAISDEDSRRAKVRTYLSNELLKKSEKMGGELNRLDPKQYRELLEDWQDTYGLSDYDMRLLEKRFLNKWSERENREWMRNKKRIQLQKKAQRIGIEEYERRLIRGEQ